MNYVLSYSLLASLHNKSTEIDVNVNNTYPPKHYQVFLLPYQDLLNAGEESFTSKIMMP